MYLCGWWTVSSIVWNTNERLHIKLSYSNCKDSDQPAHAFRLTVVYCIIALTCNQQRKYDLRNHNWFNEQFAVSLCGKLVLRHAWLYLWDKHMTTGRINQVGPHYRRFCVVRWHTDGLFTTRPSVQVGRYSPAWDVATASLLRCLPCSSVARPIFQGFSLGPRTRLLSLAGFARFQHSATPLTLKDFLRWLLG